MTSTTVPLKRLADCRDDLRRPVNATERFDMQGDIPYWGANSIQGYVTEALVDGPTVLVGEDSAPFFDRTKSVAFYIDEPIWPNNHIHVLKARPGVNPRWLAYALNCVDYSQWITGSTRDKLTQGDLMNITLPIFDPATHDAIAGFLDRETARIDAMIAAQRELVAKLEERRQGAASRILLCVPEGVDRSSGWLTGTPHPIERLGLHVKVTTGSTPSRENPDYWDGDYPWLNSSVVNSAPGSDATERVTALALQECHLPKVPAGSLLIATTGQGKARGKSTQLLIEATISQHLAAITPSGAHWNTQFLLHALRAAYSELRRISNESGSTKGAITCQDLKRFPVPRPNLEQQTRCAAEFDRVTTPLDAMTTAANDTITLMQERRVALISAAVTGRLDPHTGQEQEP